MLYPVTPSEGQGPTLLLWSHTGMEGRWPDLQISLFGASPGYSSLFMIQVSSHRPLRKSEYHFSLQVSCHLAYVVLKALKISMEQFGALLVCYVFASKVHNILPTPTQWLNPHQGPSLMDC